MRLSCVEKNKKHELAKREKQKWHVMQMKKMNENDIDSVAREILIHAAIIAGVCTLIVLVIP